MKKKIFEEMLSDLSECLLESAVILMADETAKTKKGDNSNVDIVVAIGEIQSPYSKKDYQIQVSLVVNKDLWLDEQTIGYRDTLGSFQSDPDLDYNKN